MADNYYESCAHGRFGYVSAYDPERHMAQIHFPDKDDLVSAWLPVAIPNSLKNHDERHLDVGEHVYCNMMGNGLEAGVVICSVYDDKNRPVVHEGDTRAVTFEDGTKISYDRKNHVLKVECEGDIEIHAKGQINITADGNMKQQAARIDLN